VVPGEQAATIPRSPRRDVWLLLRIIALAGLAHTLTDPDLADRVGATDQPPLARRAQQQRRDRQRAAGAD
jgi:hypothetical protein